MDKSKETDNAFMNRIFMNPDDPSLRKEYAEWLVKRGDPRGEYLTLLIKQGSDHHSRWVGGMGSKHGQFMYGITDRLDKLRPTVDPSWVALFDDFDCRVRATQMLRLRIRTTACPELHGDNAFVCDYHAGALLVICCGWEHVASFGMTYRYVRPPAGQPGNDPVISVYVPTDPELERFAFVFHRQGKSKVDQFGPWTVQYLNRRSRGGDPSMFLFGVFTPWYVELSWDAGDDKPPRWIQREASIV